MKTLFFKFVFGIFILSISNLSAQQSKNMEGTFVHAVYFWLHHPDNDAERKQFEKSLTHFINSSQFIASKHIGAPADTNREIIDNTYTYSLVITFNTKEMHDQYQVEEVHEQFRKEALPLLKKVQIYDSVSLQPER